MTSTDFSSTNPASIERAFLAHLERFERQDRDVSWQDAPAVFAGVYADDDDELTTRYFRRAMEDLFDRDWLRVERLADGSNRLVRA